MSSIQKKETELSSSCYFSANHPEMKIRAHAIGWHQIQTYFLVRMVSYEILLPRFVGPLVVPSIGWSSGLLAGPSVCPSIRLLIV